MEQNRPGPCPHDANRVVKQIVKEEVCCVIPEKTQSVLKHYSNLDRGICESDVKGDAARDWRLDSTCLVCGLIGGNKGNCAAGGDELVG